MEAFPKPSTLMGEAWFMAAERVMYPLLLGDLAALADDDILQPLEEIASGSGSFGLRDEWVEWYHYMLPRLLMQRWKPTYFQPVERLVSAFLNQHPDGKDMSVYSEFRVDALNTLGRYIMSPDFWPVGGQLDAVNSLGKWTGPSGGEGGWSAGNLLSASLFFCAKYLAPSDVEGWFRSVLAIPNRYWRVQIIKWLTGAYPMLTGEIEQPAKFPETSPFDVAWDWSHAVNGRDSGGPFLSTENCEAIVKVVSNLEIEEFLEDVWTDPAMSAAVADLAGMPEHFLRLYRDGSS